MIFNQNKWVCSNCGYTGIMPEGDPEEQMDEESIEFESEEKDSEKVLDTAAGKGYLKYELYILIPLTVLYILYLVFRN